MSGVSVPCWPADSSSWATSPAPDFVDAPPPPQEPNGQPAPAPEDIPRRPVHQAILAAMEDVRAVGKDSLYNQGGTRFQFRGVEAVMNAVAPAARRHGLIPAVVDIGREYKEGTTKAGGAKLDCYVTVTWNVYGPDGDHITVMSAGEASDTADKATSKALAVARRNMWVDLLCLATQDWDENAPQIERGERIRNAASYRDELLADTTSAGRLRQIGAELRAAGRFDELVEVDGEEVTLGALGLRVATERKATEQ